MSNELLHYGVGWDDNPPGRGSGRYEHGSGENPDQHVYSRSIYEQWKYWKTQIDPETGKPYGDGKIAQIMGYKSSTALRDAKNLQSEMEKRAKYEKVMKLYNANITSPTEIEKRTGIPEPTVRSIISRQGQNRRQQTEKTKDEIKALVKEYGFVDVGIGSELPLGISETKRKQIINELKAEGYVTHILHVEQLGTKFKTNIEVLCPEGTTIRDAYNHRFEIKPIENIVIDESGQRSILGIPKVNSVDSNRIEIRYAEDGGKDKDGVIELRRGVEDLSLGKAQYAQVRIGVDDKLYLKGMAVYGDDKEFPPGKDIIFNTNKHEGTPIEDTFKKMKEVTKGSGVIDWDNPFGASIKPEKDLVLVQREYTDKDGNKQISAINVVNEQGDWGKWQKSLSSQFLSKQPEVLIKQQLNLAYLSKKDELSDIMTIDNASVRKVMLENFADMCDSAAVDLKAMSLPRQQTHVILPLTTLKENEIYAPNYRQGEEVILIRHPHEGTYQIPRLIVNNNNKEGKSVIGQNSPDAVGISAKTAEQLSGADFDGDNVNVIPIHTDRNGNIPVRTRKAIQELVDFNAKEAYPAYPGMIDVKDQKGWSTERQMGSISNLITDMTLIGADDAELIRATKHANCIIDAEKHNLDWKRSERENGIKELKAKYQGKYNAGASTLISRASAQQEKAQEGFTFNIDDQGNKINRPTHRMEKKRRKVGEDENGRPIYKDVIDKETGLPKWKEVTQKSTKMAETTDAYTLLSGYKKVKDRITPDMPIEEAHKLIAANSYKKEVLYADYANQMKDLARKARLEWNNTRSAHKDSQAAQTYAKEVEELNAMVANLVRNAPREHQAQLRAAQNYYKKKSERNDRTKDELKKLRNQCLAEARNAVGAESYKVTLTPRQWEAIENRAISGTKVERLIKKAKTKDVLGYALSRGEGRSIPKSKQSLIRALAKGGASNADIAAQLGVSVSTVQKYVAE